MKNTIYKFIILSLLFSLFFSRQMMAQFEQKITLNISAGYFRPTGDQEYVKFKSIETGRLYNIDGETTTEYAYIYPYIMSNFNAGFNFSAGIQFNVNRMFSIAGNISFLKNFNWSYEKYYYNVFTEQSSTTDWLAYEISETDLFDWEGVNWDINGDGDTEDIIKGSDEYALYNISIGAMPKVYFIKQGTFRPYVFSELNFNYTSLNFEDNESKETVRIVNDIYDALDINEEYKPDFDPLTEMIDKSFGFGAYPGLGFDIQMNENLGLFFQGGYSIIFLSADKLEDNGLEPENFKSIRAEFGIKFSFLKSKDF